MFDNIFTDFHTITLYQIISNVFLAFVISFFISVIYRFTYKGSAYSASFVNMLVIIGMVTSLVIMVIVWWNGCRRR